MITSDIPLIGGDYKDMPGFGGSKFLGGVGLIAGSAAVSLSVGLVGEGGAQFYTGYPEAYKAALASIKEGGGYLIGGTCIEKIDETDTNSLEKWGVSERITNWIWYPVSGFFRSSG